MLSPKARIVTLSIAASVVTLGLKFEAYYLTGSVGLLSDAAESLVNISTAIIALIALQIASRPADASHAYGHDKAEYFSSWIEGTMILIAAGSIAFAAWNRLIHPAPLERLGLGLAITLVASAVNFGIAQVLLRAAKQHDSITLEADAKHLLTDVWTSVGVVLALTVVAFTGWQILDSLIAFAVAVNILFSGINLVRRSFRGLMDYTLPAEELKIIGAVLARHSDKFSDYHALRTRKSGPQRFIDLHLLVSGNQTVQETHELCEAIEAEINAALKNANIIIHVEPVEDKSSWEASSL